MSPRQIISEFRNQELRTLIGFRIFYKDINRKLESINIDQVSNNQGQTGYDSVNAIREL